VIEHALLATTSQFGMLQTAKLVLEPIKAVPVTNMELSTNRLGNVNVTQAGYIGTLQKVYVLSTLPTAQQ
jgi:hypothetical protein